MVEILERGSLSFLAVPRPAAAGAGGVERLYVVLAPEGHRALRRISVRRGRLPDAARGQRFFADVDRLASAPSQLTEDLRSPATRAAAPRVLAVGRYALARHRDHVHLAYALARACARGPLAAALGVARGASWVLCVFRRSLPPTRRPASETPLAPATPDRLDVLGAEVALVAGSRPADERLGIRAPDRVGDALVGALLRRGPRPRVASFARAAEATRRARAPRAGRRPGRAGQRRTAR